MLMWCTQMFGLLTELLARPGERGDDGYRGWANDPIRSEAVRAAELRRQEIMDYPYRVKRHPRLPYHHAKERLSQEERFKFENPVHVPVPDMLSADEQYLLTRYAQSYKLAWAQRMFPHVLGFFPYVSIWVILIRHFLDSLQDVRIENESLWDRIPDFVVPAVFGTLLIFSSFTFVQCAATHTPTFDPDSRALDSPLHACLPGGATSTSARTTGGGARSGTVHCRSRPSCSSAASSTPTCCAWAASTRRSTRQTSRGASHGTSATWERESERDREQGCKSYRRTRRGGSASGSGDCTGGTRQGARRRPVPRTTRRAWQPTRIRK